MKSQQRLIETWLRNEVDQMFYGASSRREFLKKVISNKEKAEKAEQLEELLRLIELSSSTNRLKHARNLMIIYMSIKEQLDLCKCIEKK